MIHVSARTGSGAIRTLLEAAHIVEVPDAFTDLEVAGSQEDTRLTRAIATATHIEGRGHQIAQVLAGGTQLVRRLYPEPRTYQPGQFSPAARAILQAAGDLHRVGMSSPLPRWALEGAASGYLRPPTTRPVDTWFKEGLAEVTLADSLADSVTGARALDIHADGVPAVTTAWVLTKDTPTEWYKLHDYLLQDHLTRCRQVPTRASLWETLTTNPLDRRMIQHVAKEADDRGLLTVALDLLRSEADTHMGSAPDQVARILVVCGDPHALAENVLGKRSACLRD